MDTQQQNADAALVLKQFRVIFRSVKKHSQFIEKHCQVSGSQLWALSLIAETPGIRVTAIAAGLSIHQSTASNLIDQLVRDKLVRRRRSSSDNRIVKLYLTGAGEAVIRKAPLPLRGILLEALSQLAPESLMQLSHGLEELVQKMELRDDKAGGIPLVDI